MDVHSKEVRSFNMSRIKGKNTIPEEMVRKYLFSRGFRYRKNDKRLPGKPDIVLPKYRTVIFVNGCFWHGHEGCRYFVMPKTNSSFWKEKIDTNIKRDAIHEQELTESGWKVIIIWECQLKPCLRDKTLNELCIKLENNYGCNK
jgi:DNA mismatch endonuclease (patch repair protein)